MRRVNRGDTIYAQRLAALTYSNTDAAICKYAFTIRSDKSNNATKKRHKTSHFPRLYNKKRALSERADVLKADYEQPSENSVYDRIYADRRQCHDHRNYREHENYNTKGLADRFFYVGNAENTRKECDYSNRRRHECRGIEREYRADRRERRPDTPNDINDAYNYS